MTHKWATKEDTEKYFKTAIIDPSKQRHFDTLNVSSLGMGTYLGGVDEKEDKIYEECIVKAALSGINFFDTSINYRGMRSEKILGKAIQECASRGVLRNQLVISTKGGFFPYEGSSYEEYVRKNFLETGIVEAKDIVAECHCMTERFLENQIQMSLTNLQLKSIDLYSIHNPETQLQEVGEDVFYDRLTRAFLFLEKMVREGLIQRYGIATWNGFRVKKGGLDFDRVMQAALDAGGEGHYFKAIQLPMNLVMLEALKREMIPKANEKNVSILVSNPLMQGKVLQLSNRMFEELPTGKSHVQKALEFILSTPGICTAFSGMRSTQHIEENISLLHDPVWSEETWNSATETLGLQLAKSE